MSNEDLSAEEFTRFSDYIYKASGIRLGDRKRTLVSNRVRRRLRATGRNSFQDYYRWLTSPAGAEELPRFLDEITTNETFFFRDTHQYDWLRKEYLPERLKQGGRRELAVWSAASATGEEPYSIAICLAEALAGAAGWKARVLGTDLSEQALEAARQGAYKERSLQLVDEARRRTFFAAEPGGESHRLKPNAKSLVEFKRHNLLEPLKGRLGFDCVFIKNVLIYFDNDSKQVVVEHLLRALNPGGYLVVGPAEGIFRLLGGLERQKAWLYRKPAGDPKIAMTSRSSAAETDRGASSPRPAAKTTRQA